MIDNHHSRENADNSSDGAELLALLERRWSCRAFLPQQVPDSVIHRVFQMAQMTPSWCNTQVWQTHVVSGKARDELASKLVSAAATGEETWDLPPPEKYVGIYQERRREAGYALYQSVGIERSDYEARSQQMLRNFSFFDAPHIAIITTDDAHGVYGAVDCGAYIANVLNAATALGLASIAQAAMGMQAASVRDFLELTPDRLIVAGVALGYPDNDHPVNSFRTPRADVAQSVTFVE